MKQLNLLSLSKTLVLGFIIVFNFQIVYAQNWPQWRGPLGTGIVPSGNPPIEWSEQKNVKWKSRLPGTAIQHRLSGEIRYSQPLRYHRKTAQCQDGVLLPVNRLNMCFWQ